MRRSSSLRLLFGGVAAASSFAVAAHAAPVYVYKGNGSDGRKAVSAFETFIGHKVDGVVDFIAFDSWTSFDNDASWGISGWKGSGYKLAESVPLTVQGTSLADVAAGKEDAHFTKLAQLLVANGFPDAYIRLGWEFNGGWYPWAFKGHEADFAAAFAHVAKLMRAVPGANFKIVWNPALYEQQQWPDTDYPGDGVVDVIATDAYNASWDAGYTNASTRWNSVANDSWGVAAVVAFAKKHAKPYAFPEWATGTRPDGHGGGDDPLFIRNMGPYVAASAFSGYWDYPASDFNGLISGGQYPNAGAALKSLLSGTTPAAATTTPPASTSSTPAPTQTSTSTAKTSTSSAPATPASPAPLTATVDQGGSVSVQPQPDGSAYLSLSFAAKKTAVTYTIRLSAVRQLGWSPTNVWYRNSSFTWNVAAATSSSGRVWVSAK